MMITQFPAVEMMQTIALAHKGECGKLYGWPHVWNTKKTADDGVRQLKCKCHCMSSLFGC